MVRLNRSLCTIFLALVCASAMASEHAGGEEAVWRPFGPDATAQGRRHIESLLDDAGLFGRFVFYVDFDREGKAWIASSAGLYVYDGYTWTQFSQSDGLPSNFVRSLKVARDGTVWVGNLGSRRRLLQWARSA